jgi:hypothetical protein
MRSIARRALSSSAVTSVLCARGDGCVSWVHVGLGSRVRRGDKLLTLNSSPLASPFDGVISWVRPWTHVDGARELSPLFVREDDSLLRLQRTPPEPDNVLHARCSSLDARQVDTVVRAIASVAPRRELRSADTVRAPDVFAIASDLRAGLGAHCRAWSAMSQTERRALLLAQRGASDFELYVAISMALLDGDVLLRTTRSAERLINL